MRQRETSDQRSHVQQRFGDVAANYRLSRVHAAGPDLDGMLSKAALGAGARVLDAGCGAGHTALAFAPHAERVIACDFTPAMLRQVTTLAAERGARNINPQLADVDNLPFGSDSFDLVASRYSAHHWLHPQQALAEFRRVLRSRGSLLISDIMASEDYAQDTFLQAIELLRDPSHVRDYRISEWRALMSRAGFRPELVMRFDLRLHFATWTHRMKTPRANADMILALFDGAADDIRAAFQLPARISGEDFSFVIPGAVIRGTLPAP